MPEAIDFKTPYLRRQWIVELLQKEKMTTLEKLQKAINVVSFSTIRRDILHLQAHGQVLLLRGGSVKLYDAHKDELPVDEKFLLNKVRKERIAKHAASFVRDRETIYIDSGTTTALMLKYIRELNITIITSSTYVIQEAEHIKGTILILGGEMIKDIASISGPTTDRQMSELYYDRAFIGASAFSLVGGVSTYDMREASKKRIAKEHASVTYVLADSSKAGRSALCKAFSLKDCVLITDEANEITSSVNAVIAP